MSTFRVENRIVVDIKPADNADKLDLVFINDSTYQFVVGKGTFQVNDIVTYFPLDAVLPVHILKKANLWLEDKKRGMLGRGGDTVQTVKLRGNLSQGVLVLPSLLGLEETMGLDFTEKLGVTKYEPPIQYTSSAKLVPLPSDMAKYDIENGENYPHIIDKLMDIKVYVTEKLEGSNWAYRLDTAGGSLYSRNFRLDDPDPNHPWVLALKRDNWYEIAKTVRNWFGAQTVVLRGEIIGKGMNGNIYGYNDVRVRLFDIETDNRYVNSNVFFQLAHTFEFNTVPLLSHNITLREWVGVKTCSEMSHGYSLLNSDVFREGIVIKPAAELPTDSKIGRVFVKYRDPVYLEAH